MGAPECRERLRAHLRHRRPDRPRTDPSIPLGQAEHALGGLHGDELVFSARCPQGAILGPIVKRRWRRGRAVGDAAGAEKHLKKKKGDF